METQIDASLETSECIKSYQNFTETVYTNICTGKVTEVPYGTLDLVLGFFSVTLVAVLIGMILTLIYKAVTDSF